MHMCKGPVSDVDLSFGYRASSCSSINHRAAWLRGDALQYTNQAIGGGSSTQTAWGTRQTSAQQREDWSLWIK